MALDLFARHHDVLLIIALHLFYVNFNNLTNGASLTHWQLCQWSILFNDDEAQMKVDERLPEKSPKYCVVDLGAPNQKFTLY